MDTGIADTPATQTERNLRTQEEKEESKMKCTILARQHGGQDSEKH